MDKILTVVIPTYNMEKYLRKCLDSLIIDDQDLIDKLGVLVVNDGSKDSSSDIAHQYQDKYPEVFRVIDKENGNYGSCVNRGLKEAVGKYIKVLDADDTFETNNFSDYLEFLVNNDVDCVISDMMQVDEDGKCKALCRFNFPSNTPFGLDEMGENEWRKLWMHCVCYKTINLRNINYHQTEGISYTDTEWSLIPMIMVNTFYYYPHFLYKYLKGREGQTVEGITYIKRTPQRMQIFLRLLKELGTLDRSKKQTMYFEYKIRQFALEIYRILIVECPSVIDGKVLIDFDTEIKKLNHIFYKELASDKIKKYYPVKYIAQWRNNGGKIPFLVKFFAVCRKIVKNKY